MTPTDSILGGPDVTGSGAGWGVWPSRAELAGWSPVGYRDGLWHALGQPWPALGSHTRPPSTQAGPVPGEAGTAGRETLCGTVADVTRYRGVFDPDRYSGRVCPACVWWEAIRTDSLTAEVARLAAEPARGLTVAVAEAVLAHADQEYGDPHDREDADWADTVELLAAITAHAGQELFAHECVEGDCDHDGGHDGQRVCPVLAVACAACSITDREGGYRREAMVAVPCSLLTTMADHFQVGAALLENTLLPGTLHAPAVVEADDDGRADVDAPINYVLTGRGEPVDPPVTPSRHECGFTLGEVSR